MSEQKEGASYRNMSLDPTALHEELARISQVIGRTSALGFDDYDAIMSELLRYQMLIQRVLEMKLRGK